MGGGGGRSPTHLGGLGSGSWVGVSSRRPSPFNLILSVPQIIVIRPVNGPGDQLASQVNTYLGTYISTAPAESPTHLH